MCCSQKGKVRAQSRGVISLRVRASGSRARAGGAVITRHDLWMLARRDRNELEREGKDFWSEVKCGAVQKCWLGAQQGLLTSVPLDLRGTPRGGAGIAYAWVWSRAGLVPTLRAGASHH